jgi:hypothetical protein
MRSRILVGALLMVGMLAASALATAGDGFGPSTRTARVNFVNPVRINGAYVMGKCLIVHDDSKMARGEPCTTIYRFDARKGAQQEIVSFHCQPKTRAAVDANTLTIVPDVAVGVPTLIEYQFAGDIEGHGVPQGR